MHPHSRCGRDDQAGEDGFQPLPKDDRLECCGKSLNLFTPDNRFRKLCFRIVTHKVFDNIIMMFILLSGVRTWRPWPLRICCCSAAVASAHALSPSLSLPPSLSLSLCLSLSHSLSDQRVLCHPYLRLFTPPSGPVPRRPATQVVLALQSNASEPTPGWATFFQVSDIVFNLIFFLECGAKVVALGWHGTGQHAYAKNPWNLSDFILLLGSSVCTCRGPRASFACARLHRRVVLVAGLCARAHSWWSSW
jgi:hypothetical protein